VGEDSPLRLVEKGGGNRGSTIGGVGGGLVGVY